jgi:hypothetical protein
MAKGASEADWSKGGELSRYGLRSYSSDIVIVVGDLATRLC